MFKICQLTTEYLTDPIGLDCQNPRFSWVLQSDRPGSVQTKYSICVKQGETVVFKRTKRTAQSIQIRYEGKPLQPSTRYDVTLQAEDNQGEKAQATAFFETGLLHPYNFTASFVTAAKEYNCFRLEKEFVLPGPVKSARLYATALGLYEVCINGRKVGDAYFAPYWTSYPSRLEYQTYDITDYLADENRVEMTLAEGWFKGEYGYENKREHYGNTIAGLIQIQIVLKNGQTIVWTTDESWKVRESEIRYTSIYHGESVDTCVQTQLLGNAKIYEGYPVSRLIGQINEPVRVTQTLQPKEIFLSPKGELLVDFGQNLVGVVCLEGTFPAGKELKISHAEVLDQGCFFTENLRDCRAQDRYIPNGSAQKLLPRFTFHGFRYAKIEGIRREELQGIKITALVLHSDLRRTGYFRCSDARINRLYENILWSQRGNFVDIPTDCPQRNERLGWTGDAQVFSSTACLNYHCALFFQKWLGDLSCEQTKENGVPHVVPNLLEKREGAACWGDAATVIPYVLYQVYADQNILEQQYRSMVDWIEYIRANCSDGLWKRGFQYGDWLALDNADDDLVGATDVHFIANAFYLHSLEILCEVCKLLHKKADLIRFRRLYSRTWRAFRAEYVTKGGRLVSETQTACVLALHFRLLKKSEIPGICRILAEKIRLRKNHLSTGFAGTPYLLLALSEHGMHELAGKILLNEDFPGWLYEVRHGATTIWERWDGLLADGKINKKTMNSFNHYAYGSVGEWLYKKMLGIEAIEAAYHRFKVEPAFVEGIEWVQGAIDTAFGKIEVDIHYDAKTMSVQVPFGTEAEIVCPNGKKYFVQSGKHSYNF